MVCSKYISTTLVAHRKKSDDSILELWICIAGRYNYYWVRRNLMILSSGEWYRPLASRSRAMGISFESALTSSLSLPKSSADLPAMVLTARIAWSNDLNGSANWVALGAVFKDKGLWKHCIYHTGRAIVDLFLHLSNSCRQLFGRDGQLSHYDFAITIKIDSKF